MARRSSIVLVASLLFLPLAAQTADFQVTAGFGGQCRMGAWTPVTVRLQNPTGDGGSGTITTVNGLDEQMPFETPFSLPASSRKQYTHYIPFDDPMGELAVRIVETEGKLPFTSGVAVKTPVTTVQNGLFVVVAGPARASLNFLANLPVPTAYYSRRGVKMQSGTIFAARVDPATLPDRPMGYEGVDLLVLSDFLPSSLDTKQISALKMWLAGGGTLLVNGGANFQQFQNEFYADILPMDVTKVLQLSDLNSLQRYHRSQIQAGSVAICGGQLRPDAQVELSQGGTPLISGRQYGLGQVYFFAFDYSGFPVRGWDGQTDLMSNWIGETHHRMPIGAPNKAYSYGGMPAPSVYGYGGAADVNPIEAVAGQLPSVTTPSFELILGFMLAYLVLLVPVNYFVLSRMKRRELAWISTPAVILLFTIGAYGMGYAMKGGNLLLRTITVVESGPNARYGIATSYACLFSPSRRTYDLRVADPFAVVSEAHPNQDTYNPRNRSRNERDITVLLAETTTLPDIAMDMWGMRTFRVESGTDLKGTVEADLDWNPGTTRLAGTVVNNTAYDLHNCEILVRNGSLEIGDLGRGGKVKVDGITRASLGVMPQPSGGGMPAPSANKPRRGLSKFEEGVEQQVIARLAGAHDVTLIGWSETSPADIQLRRGRGESQTANCFVFRLPVHLPATAGVGRGGRSL